ncbi:MAG: BACON domain-containing protein [Bacteroidales bacterium]|nr:BACON domain-containing protein [Bacteroidales bacterium]
MKKTIISVFAFFAILLCSSCDKNYHEVFAPDELGMAEHEFLVERDGGDFDVTFLANKKGSISLMDRDDYSWVQLGTGSFGSDGTLSVHVDPNNGFKRRADILFSTSTRKDTVSIFQKGAVEEKFYIAASSMMVYNGTGEPSTVATDINIPIDEVTTEVRISGADEWIKDCRLTSSSLTFSTTDNTDRSYMRRAYIVLSYVDGWKEKQSEMLTVIQARADNNIGSVFTAEDLRSVATVGGYALPDDALIEGYIVSTTEGGNAGDAQVSDYQQGTGVIDYTLTKRTSYLESADGRYGFRLIAALSSTGEYQNDFIRYSIICLKAGGAVVKRSETEPYCYTIEGVSSDNILTSADGTSSMPWKEKHIGELTDDDINTLVKIKDCEIAMRKGPFTPVNEGYTSACGYNRLAKYPILIRDIEGGSMYMFTNMSCTYRRTGETLPYGSGDITGIVVHEPYYSFEKNGNIGRYQLRHLVREEIDLKQDFADNFSGIITEFRYAKFPGEFDETVLENPILATKGNGELCHTYGSVSNFSPTYFYIGKSGSKYKNKYEEGAGIELDEGGIYQPWVDNGTESSQNTDGKGWFKDNLKLSWSNKYWWDSGNSRGYCWLVNFSTEGIVSDKVSMQFAMYNNSQQARSPRYWKAQYSLTTTDTSADSDSEWTDIGEFTVPDVAIWASQNDWQSLAPRVYDFPLPTEILGKPSVSIRLMPRSNRAASKSVDSYDDNTIANNSGYNTMDYFAVRYNK